MLLKQAREKGITIPFMGGDGLDSGTLVEIAGTAAKIHFIRQLRLTQQKKQRRAKKSLLRITKKEI
ncbi:hypothetical protein GCM10020331_050330 [Ectobacillus funiculus]